MKNKINVTLVFLLLLNIIPLTAQVLSGEVIYKQKVIENVFDSIAIQKIDLKFRGELDFVNESLRNHSDNFEFKLKFNRTESIYELVEKMQNDADKGYRIAAKFSRINDVYYINMQRGEKLVQKESFGELFVIKYDLNNIKWKLFNKTKIIKNYKCFMASTTKIVKNSKGVFEKPVIAWYTPEIPLNYGPKGYGNLPGLILELNEDKLKFYATKIMLNLNETIEITEPNKGKHLTDKEFELKQKEMSRGFWKGK
jgi:GLPGLI family protein